MIKQIAIQVADRGSVVPMRPGFQYSHFCAVVATDDKNYFIAGTDEIEVGSLLVLEYWHTDPDGDKIWRLKRQS